MTSGSDPSSVGRGEGGLMVPLAVLFALQSARLFERHANKRDEKAKATQQRRHCTGTERY